MALRAYADNIKRSYIDACNAVLARGGNVPSGMPISDLSSAILNIPHDQTLAYYKQENTKHIITVPRNSEPYARIGKIGGMTYKSENYFDKSKVTNDDIPITVTDTGFKFTNTVAQNNPTPIGYLKNLAPELKVGDVVTFYANVVNASIDRGYGFLYITEAKVDWLGGNFITITEMHLSGMVYAYGALNKVCEYKNLIITKEENAPYSPYFEGLRDTKVTELRSEGASGKIDTLAISEALIAFLADKGYGGGASGYPNDMVFDSKKFVRRTYRKVFDGTEPWIANGTDKNDAVCYNLISLPVINVPAGVWHSSDIAEDGIVTYYDVESGTDVYLRNRGVALMDDRINIYDPNYNTTDVSLWKAHLADLYAQGKPLIAEYIMAEPIEYDISAYLIDDLIKVEGDGTITAVSEYNYDMPSEVNYIINTVGG